MANEKEKIERKNLIEVEGYLKANTLERRTTSTGKEAIMGLLTIALSETEDHRIRYMVTKFKNDGQLNAKYDGLEKMLPENTTSIATLLEGNPNATFNGVKEQATKVYAKGSFDVFDKKSENGVITTFLTIRGLLAIAKTENAKHPFSPRTFFDIEGYIDGIKDEKDKEGEETGRIIVSLLLPDDYREEILPCELICESDSAKAQISQHEKGSTARFQGAIRNTREEKVQEKKETEFLDGSTQDDSRVTYTFVNENVAIRMTGAYEEGDVKTLTPELVKKYRTNRQKKLDEMPVSADKGKSGAQSGDDFVPMSTPTTPNPKAKGFEL